MVDIVAAKPYLKAKEREEDEFLRSKKIKVVLKPIKISDEFFFLQTLYWALWNNKKACMKPYTDLPLHALEHVGNTLHEGYLASMASGFNARLSRQHSWQIQCQWTTCAAISPIWLAKPGWMDGWWMTMMMVGWWHGLGALRHHQWRKLCCFTPSPMAEPLAALLHEGTRQP